MDLQMATQHSRVHQALMEGTAKVFAAWIKRDSAKGGKRPARKNADSV